MPSKSFPRAEPPCRTVPICPQQPAAAGPGARLRLLPTTPSCFRSALALSKPHWFHTADSETKIPLSTEIQTAVRSHTRLLISTLRLLGHTLDTLTYTSHSTRCTSHSKSNSNWSRALFFWGDFWQAS